MSIPMDLLASDSSDKVTPEIDEPRITKMEEPAVTDPVFAHLTETFPSSKLMQLKYVSKEWGMLIRDNIKSAAAKAHWDEGVLRDWYFPLRFSNRESDNNPWIVSGVHTASANLQLLRLLPANTDPICSKHLSPNAHYLVAISGGLLLFSPTGSDSPTFDTQNGDQLLVWNPVTQESRVLPPHDGHNMRAHFVVDESAHSYKVILINRDCVLVYKSTTNRWSFRKFRNPVPWELGAAASAVMNGKLYFGELETVDGNVVRSFLEMFRSNNNLVVIEVDDEAGTWTPLARHGLGSGKQYTLGSIYMQNTVETLSQTLSP